MTVFAHFSVSNEGKTIGSDFTLHNTRDWNGRSEIGRYAFSARQGVCQLAMVKKNKDIFIFKRHGEEEGKVEKWNTGCRCGLRASVNVYDYRYAVGHESIEPVSPLNRRISCEQTISPVKFRKFGKFTLKRRINSNPSLILINPSLHDKSHRLFDREQRCMNNTSFSFLVHNREQKAKNRTFILRFPLLRSTYDSR